MAEIMGAEEVTGRLYALFEDSDMRPRDLIQFIRSRDKAIVERIRHELKGTQFEHSLDLIFDDVLRELEGE